MVDSEMIIAQKLLIAKNSLYITHIYTYIATYVATVTGFMKTIPNRTFCILENTNLKYSRHCSSLMLDCSHAKSRLVL